MSRWAISNLVSKAALALVVAVSWSVADMAGAAAQEKVSVRMDWVFSGYHAPYFAGVKNGFYEEEGLEVTVLPGNGSGNVAQAIGSGNGEFATVDGGTMMQLVSKGLPVKSVMGLYQRNPTGLIFAERSGIKVPKDVEGKTMVVTHGDGPSLLFPAFAESAGIDVDKINIVNTDAASKYAAIISGNADATVTFSFLAVPIINAAGVKAASLDYADNGVNVPGISVIAHRDYIEANPETIAKFVRATRKAFAWSQENPDEAIAILVELNPDQKIDADIALEVLKSSFNLLHTQRTADKPIGLTDPQDWADAENILAKYLDLEKGESPERYYTNEFAE